MSIKRESGPPEVRCYECGQPERVHGVPGPPSPPPYMPCDSFTEPPDRNTLITDVYLTRRQRDEYKREANRWRRELLEIGKRVTRATDEGNFS